jgi:hypothetical protein
LKRSEVMRKVKRMKFRQESIYYAIRELILRDGLASPLQSEELVKRLRDATLRRVSVSTVATYMKPFVKGGVVKSDIVRNKRVWYASWVVRQNDDLSSTFPFPKGLMKRLGSKFEPELEEMKVVWGKCGDCMAFLVRKTVEKAIYLAFAKQGMIDNLKDPSDTPKFAGLEKMIDIASRLKTTSGVPFLVPRTADRLKKAKFLGDTAAHDFLANVYVEQVEQDINVIVTALDELSGAW